MIPKWKYLLWPLVLINRLRIRLRNLLFELGIWKSATFEFPVIFVGALDNTPTKGVAIYLSELLKAGLHIQKAHIKMYKLSTEENEDHHYLSTYRPNLLMTKNKALGISEWYQSVDEGTGLVMDGEFAQNEIKPALRILVADYHQPWSQNRLWPLGSLNGIPEELENTDVILVCNCPQDMKKGHEKLELPSGTSATSQVFYIGNSPERLSKHNYLDKIEFIEDRDNFERLIMNVMPITNRESE